MSLSDLGIEGYESKTLLVDGDIIIYQPCCIFNEDDDQSRKLIAKNINQKLERLMSEADCDQYIMFVTTKFNFRDQLVDDYKFNRQDVERPINLHWAKKWAVQNLNTHFHKGMEADDLLGTHQTENTVIWSLDKDLRQIPGLHLDDATGKVKTITEAGHIEQIITYKEKPNGKTEKKTKYLFEGTLGFQFQMLTGDTTDYIVGCAKRVNTVIKSGPKKGQTQLKRVGVGPGAAYKLLVSERDKSKTGLEVVIAEYKKVHGDEWQAQLETQANLLFMVRKQYGEIIQRWTYDEREEYFDLVKGVIVHDYDKETA